VTTSAAPTRLRGLPSAILAAASARNSVTVPRDETDNQRNGDRKGMMTSSR
jgi:hypothetical protein